MKTANLAIVFTDIKDFTSRTSQQTLAENERMLRVHDALLTPCFKAFGGRLVKTIGDAFLVVFESPTQAVLCGVAIQDRLWDYNRRVPPKDQIHVRVAVNMGEVRLEKGDVYGEPVNIAARVEGLADAGEVVFTEVVYLAMNKAEVPAEDGGFHELKGIPEKVRIYRVPRGDYRLAAAKATEPAPELAVPAPPSADAPPYGGIALARLGDLPAPDPANLTSSGELFAKMTSRATDLAVDAARGLKTALPPMQRLLQRLRTLPLPVKMGAVGAVAALVLVVVGLSLFRDPIESAVEKGDLEGARALVSKLEEGPARTYYEGRIWELRKEHRSAARQYAEASKGGDERGFDRLLEMTTSETCEVRASAARVLGKLGNRDAISALETLSQSTFKDEGGEKLLDALFACHSKRAAEEALAALKAKAD